MSSDQSNNKKIVVIGGGFGGVFTTQALVEKLKKAKVYNVNVELISERNYFVFHPLLPEVAAGTINAQDAVTPLRLLVKGAKTRLAEVQHVDFANKCIHILQGQRKLIQHIHYDELVIGSGQITDLSLFPGFTQHSMTMKDVSDAYKLRNHVIRCLEMADVTKFADIKRRALTFVVAGGGFSGVETMGELVEMIRRTLKFYPNIAPDEIRPVLIQRGNQLLPEMNANLGKYTLQALKGRGVEVMLKTGIISASATCVKTDTEQVIETMTIVTTIGNGPSPFVKKLGIELNRGKIEVNSYFQTIEKSVWALGDSALVPLPTLPPSKGDVNNEETKPLYAPPTAQFTVREAKFAANNIVAAITGGKMQNFDYKPKGMLASLGNYQGVAEIFGFTVKGLPAWLIWRALYIGMLPGFPTRLRVALNWLFDYFLPRTIVQMAENVERGTQYRHYNKGDTLLSKEQVLDGFYIVASGRLKLQVPPENNEEMFERELVAGDHVGEQILSKNKLTTCTLTALEDSIVLVLNPEDFLVMREHFKGFDNYFENLDSSRYSPLIRDS